MTQRVVMWYFLVLMLALLRLTILILLGVIQDSSAKEFDANFLRMQQLFTVPCELSLSLVQAAPTNTYDIPVHRMDPNYSLSTSLTGFSEFELGEMDIMSRGQLIEYTMPDGVVRFQFLDQNATTWATIHQRLNSDPFTIMNRQPEPALSGKHAPWSFLTFSIFRGNDGRLYFRYMRQLQSKGPVRKMNFEPTRLSHGAIDIEVQEVPGSGTWDDFLIHRKPILLKITDKGMEDLTAWRTRILDAELIRFSLEYGMREEAQGSRYYRMPFSDENRLIQIDSDGVLVFRPPPFLVGGDFR